MLIFVKIKILVIEFVEKMLLEEERKMIMGLFLMFF